MEWDKDDLDYLNEYKNNLRQIDNGDLLDYFIHHVIQCQDLERVDNTFCKMVLELVFEETKMDKEEILERMGGNNNA